VTTVTTRCNAAWWRVPAVGSLLLTLSALTASADAPKRVFILHSFGLDVAPYSAVASGFRTTLARELGQPADFDEVSLDLARYDDTGYQAALVEFVTARLASRSVDLVVTNGAPAIAFAAQHRERLFPATPIVIAGGDPRVVPPGLVGRHAVQVGQRANIPGMVEDILQLEPDTTTIAVVFGNSALEQFWEGECRREFAAFADRVEFTWLSGMSLDGVLGRCASLPPRSFILFVFLTVDGTGVPHGQDEVLRRLHEVANAPVFAYFASALGRGAVGGRLFQDHEIGVLAARAAVRVLRGESPERIPPLILENATPTYDWRELRRWGIRETRLPAGSVVVFRQPTFWQRNWRWITGLVSLCLLQAGLILGLLLSRARRRAAEHVLRDFGRRLIRSQEETRTQLARELHDDVTQRLARLAIDVGVVERDASDCAAAAAMGPLHAELTRLSEDVHALAYRLHPSILEDLGLAAALSTEAERFSRQHAVAVKLALHELPAVVPQDTALGLFRVAQEALRNVARHAGAGSVGLSLRSLNGGLQLVVHDDGAGFAPDPRRCHRGLGLTSMRERIELLGGTLDIESAPGRGTTVVAWVPIKGEPA
jgi:signal transduction histidine kinase